ncbi:hypothetical protein GQ600_1005 [Phytophthora cactorum]|nr:hypothetical protein GQ600_1005 [Phytophthora cactorum]
MEKATVGVTTYNGGDLFVALDGSKSVRELKQEIKREEFDIFYSCEPKLYRAKRGDGTWLRHSVPDVQYLRQLGEQQGEMPVGIKAMMNDANELDDDLALIGDEAFGFLYNDECIEAEEVIHLVVHGHKLLYPPIFIGGTTLNRSHGSLLILVEH